MNRWPTAAVSALWVLVLHPHHTYSHPIPAGSEFRVSTGAGDYRPAVSFAPDRSFVVVWNHYGGSGISSLLAQRYSSTGEKTGADFEVTSPTIGRGPGSSSLAYSSSGDFVAIWDNVLLEFGSSQLSVSGQRFSSSGVLVGTEFFVASFTTTPTQHADAHVAAAPNGDFVVVWQSYLLGTGNRVLARWLDASALPRSLAIQVNAAPGSREASPSVFVAPDGTALVAWVHQASGAPPTVLGRRFNSSNTPIGTEFQISSYTTSWDVQPDVTAAASDFTIVWARFTNDEGSRIMARRCSVDGTLGPEFQVNSGTADRMYYPSIAATTNGEFVVAWESRTSDPTDEDVFARSFRPTGLPAGDDVRINTSREGIQTNPAVAVDDDGNFVIAWESNLGDASGWRVYGQRFADCGNGSIALPEECDDGNVESGDGCDSNCTTTGCGNGIVTDGESCDDGNVNDGDGCESNCTLSPTRTPTPTLTPTASFTVSPTRSFTLTPTTTLTPTNTHTPTQTLSPSPTPPVVEINAASVRAAPGRVLRLPISIRSFGFPSVATTNEISYDPSLFALDPTSCDLEATAPRKELLASALPAVGNLNSIRVFVTSPVDNAPIPDGSLYSCSLRVLPSTSPGEYQLPNRGIRVFGPNGLEHPWATGSTGSITVSLVGATCATDCDS